MRAIWSGSIAFGLISIPVKLYSAIERTRPDFRLLHEADGERVHYKRVCSKGHEVDWDEIVKGYEYEKGSYATFTQDELASLEAESLRNIDVVSFVPLEDIDPIFFDATYYVAPQESGIKAYHLLREALEAEEVAGVAKVAIREREHLAAVRLKDGLLVLQTMHWPEQIREAALEELERKPEVRNNEVKMARQLIQQLTGPFEPEQFEDEYRKAVEAAVKKKIEGEEIAVPAPEERPAEVVDLMDALRSSVEEARKGRRGGRGRKQPTRRQAPAAEELEALSKDELYERAKKLGIQGRSNMDKPELIDAISGG